MGEIGEFALTFDGNDKLGFDGCETLANSRLYRTLTEARACLFFEQRRWRYFGYDPDAKAMAFISDLLESIRGHVASEDRA